MIEKIRQQLIRLNATRIQVAEDSEFEPKVGRLLRVALDNAYWHLPPQHFLELLKAMPNGSGDDAVHQAIERESPAVWHGPAPEDSRDTPL